MMKYKFWYILFIAFLTVVALPKSLNAQKNGDTIFVKTWHFGTNNRDTNIQFPSGNLSFEKIIMKYSMRCKNGLVSDQNNRNKGCGEWDYSCNTFLVDSSKIETIAQTAPNFTVSNFTGNTFKYSKKPIYDYYDYNQTKVIINSSQNEKIVSLGNSTSTLNYLVANNAKSAKTQILYTANELVNAGFDSGFIHGISLTTKNAGTANFLKIRLKNVMLSKLSSKDFSMTNFTEVFHASTSFNSGKPR